MKKFISVLGVVILFSTCYVSKSLEREVRVAIVTNFTTSVTNGGNSTFSVNYSDAEYKDAFLEGMKSEFSGNKIIIDEQNPEFTIVISSFSINESTIIETVEDADSPDNGKSFELTELDLEARGTVSKNGNSELKSWFANKQKSEKVTNNRSGGQIITGDNKDHNTYREKEFSNSVVKDLAEKCGRRSGARIINDIIKMI